MKPNSFLYLKNSGLIDAKLFEIISDWQKYLYYEKNFSENTVNSYIKDLRYFINFLNTYLDGDVISISQVKQVDIRSFRAWLASKVKAGASVNSIKLSVAGLRNFYRFLIKANYVENSQIFNLILPKKKKELPKNIEFEEIQRAVQHISCDKKIWVKKRNEALLLLIYNTGVRISEALSITDEDVPYHAVQSLLTIEIKGKGGHRRNIYLLPKVVEAINIYRQICPYKMPKTPKMPSSKMQTSKIATKEAIDKGQIKGGGQKKISTKLFLGERGGQVSARVFQLEIENLRKQNIASEYFTPHSLRHSFATDMLTGGCNIREVQQFMGHKSLASTQVYTKLNVQKLATEFLKFD